MHRVVPRSTAGSAVSTAPSIAPSTAPSTAPSITLSVAPIPTPCPTPWLCSCSSAPSPASAAEQIASPKRLSEVRGGGAVVEGMCPGMGCTSCFPMVALRKGRGVSPHCPGERGLCTGKKGDEAHFGMLPCYAPPSMFPSLFSSRSENCCHTKLQNSASFPCAGMFCLAACCHQLLGKQGA